MNSVTVSLIALFTIVGATWFGVFLRTLLDEHQLNADSRDVMKLGTALIATLVSLVLSLLTASAKSTYDTLNSGMIQNAFQITLLDRTLAQYGPETKEAREDLRRTVTTAIEALWPKEMSTIAVEKIGQSEHGIEDLEEKIWQLSPQNDKQRLLQAQALQILGEINARRLLLIEHLRKSSFPMPLLLLLMSWLSIIFCNYGLLTPPRNRTVLAVLFFCALAAASSLFLILELDQPFGGFIMISDSPMVNALSKLGR